MPRITWSDRVGLRKLAEESITKGHVTRAGREMAYARLVHELDVHAAELEMQNDALREAQRDLEASRAEYRSLFELAPMAYVAIDKEGRISAANIVASELLGMSRDDIIGIRLARFVALGEGAAFHLHQREVQGTRARIRAEFTIVRRDGESRAVRFESQCTNPVLGEWRAALLDLTETAELERRLEQTERLSVLGTHATGIVHDFKNILATVLTSAEIALRQLDPESAARRPLERLKQVTLRGGLVVSQLLAYARDEYSEPGMVDLNDLISSFEPALRAQLPKGIELSLDLSASNASVRAHGEQIEQALLNLVQNAQHAMPAGGTIDVVTEDVEFSAIANREGSELVEGRYIAVRVTDTGAGMDEKIRARAFEPFFTTKPSGRGSGLGLVMVQGLAHRAGGHATIESEPGRGTIVTVFFPRASGFLKTPSERPPVGEPLPAELVVVVVSDDAASRMVARDHFRAIGCHSFDAANGFEALRVLKECRKGVVVLLVDDELPNLKRPEFVNAAGAIASSVHIASVPLAGRKPADLEETGPVSQSHFAMLYDAVVRALSGMTDD
jgi:PAS domain S-box-containing protein